MFRKIKDIKSLKVYKVKKYQENETKIKEKKIIKDDSKLGNKVHIFWEGHKILRNLHQLFDWQYIGQIIGGVFAKLCGLLRIYELWNFSMGLLKKCFAKKLPFLSCQHAKINPNIKITLLSYYVIDIQFFELTWRKKCIQSCIFPKRLFTKSIL